jgi:hypothetical protein
MELEYWTAFVYIELLGVYHRASWFHREEEIVWRKTGSSTLHRIYVKG